MNTATDVHRKYECPYIYLGCLVILLECVEVLNIREFGFFSEFTITMYEANVAT